jgi:hypothetical protein
MTPTLTPTATPTETGVVILDFAAVPCLAAWSNAQGSLPCPGTYGSAQGSILMVEKPQFEDGAVSNRRGLVTSPQFIYGGSITGFFPPVPVQNGYHFRTTLGCEYQATSCSVLFKLTFKIDNGSTHVFWAYGKQYDGNNPQVDVDLSLLSGENVSFGLSAYSVGFPNEENRAVWIAPRIVQVGPIQ